MGGGQSVTTELRIIIPTFSRAHLLPFVIEKWQQRIPRNRIQEGTQK